MTHVASTPAATSSANDQTAVIFEFDCIYSHDIQRKRQKRWHDGYLRFHAFNRRVMVYDVPRNFIGDTHLRDTDTLQDGDELQLDRGVLVEVGESRGASRQNVTPLFEKKRPQPQPQRRGAAETPPTRPTYSSPPTASALLKPKPLNVVLGPRRGLQGRAVLAKHSPYEETKSPETSRQASEFERPAKRPRVEEPRRGPPAPRKNTEQHVGIRTASSLLPADRSSRPITVNEREPQRTYSATRNISSPPPVRDKNKRNTAKIAAPLRNTIADQPLDSQQEHTSAQGKDRMTSKLKVSATKRPKLMCLSGSGPSQISNANPARSTEQNVPQRRAPLRVSAMNQSSSPTSGNFTIMDFPTSQDVFAEQTPVPRARTLEELDRQLLQSPELPEARPVTETAPAPENLQQPASPVPAVIPPPPILAAPPAPEPFPAEPVPAIPDAPVPQPHKPATTKAITAPHTSLPPSAPPPAVHTLGPTAAGPNRSLRPRTSPLKKALTDPAPVTRPATKNTTAAATATSKPASLPPSKSTTTGTMTVTTTKPQPQPQPQPQPASTEANIGPWSRTAFDLFGFVVPAGAKEHEVRALKKRVTAIRGSVRGMMREYCD